MKKKKDLMENLQLGLVFIVLAIGLIFVVGCFQEKGEKTSSPPADTLKDKNMQENVEEEIKLEDETVEEEEDNNADIELPEEDITQGIPSVTKSEETKAPSVQNNSTPVSKNQEKSLVSYFEDSIAVLENSKDKTDPTVLEKAKNLFTEAVDFLFYGSSIKGYTFQDLTTKTKLKIVELTLKLDHKIDTHFPNYKNKIKEKATNLKGRAALLYLETTSKLCEGVGEDTCQEARKNFKNMKNSFGFTWDIIKEAATDVSTSLKTILSEWYQSIK